MTETSFVKAQSDNLSKIDVFMMSTYFASNSDLTAAELRGVKSIRRISKEVVLRNGKPECDKDYGTKMKNTIAKLIIFSPDLSGLCTCDTDCFPAKRMNPRIDVSIERVEVPGVEDFMNRRRAISLPVIQDSVSQEEADKLRMEFMSLAQIKEEE